MNVENLRLQEAKDKQIPWRKWGPYLSERQWGTVREDYSENGDAWNYFTHDQARSRAYRWGEDGLGGICDDHQLLCFALALWNGKDPILKERMFGLTNSEGNHGEDVKEYYYYLDSTPTHSYMKFLYKYPQRAYPYDNLVETNRRRSRKEMEYELIATGAFNDDRYFDIFVEYAKASPEDLLIKITVCNRGPEAAPLHVLPTLWFRNTWSWRGSGSKPVLRSLEEAGYCVLHAHHTNPILQEHLQDYYLYCEDNVPLLFTENETNEERLFGKPNASPFVKDGINNFIVHGQQNAINPESIGTKASSHYRLSIASGESHVLRLRLTKTAPDKRSDPFEDFDSVFRSRLEEADEFYSSITPPTVGSDAANVMRQALAGMLWSKQYYYFDANLWLDEHHANPLDPKSRQFRNRDWFHMINDDIISMPDKWEYPWYAAWDLAFHTIALSVVDPDYAKQQLDLMLTQMYLHPNGQIPAYEWNFSDVNPPVHAWAALFLHFTTEALQGEEDIDFLKSAFHKLLLNFTWWVNRKDRFGKNVFEGGFLGLDNIGVFDRSSPLPTGGSLEQADGTAWMALFSQNMIELSIELASYDPTYETMAGKFTDHFYWIAAAINRPGIDGMWDEEDGFYYDILRLPDGSAKRLKVRSMVGLLPMCATTVIEKWQRDRIPSVMTFINERMHQMPELFESIHPTGQGHLGVADRGIIALLKPERLRRVLSKMLDEDEFLSPYGIRSLSKYHERNPYVFYVSGKEYRVDYLPAESDSGMFGGNSNWRGPVWFPVNILIIRALLQFYLFYGDSFKVECPTGSGKMMNLFEVSREIADRLAGIFLGDEQGRRPVNGGTEKFQLDPNWRDLILFYEYFHADNGAGLGASHQTGWTGLVAKTIQLFGYLDAKRALQMGKKAAFTPNSGKD
jgi:Mannosylglycerate hydrolase MGH1-like glycoside hydrolase domain